MDAVILAGGRGTRLMPYTTVLPKPLLPVGEQPVIEIILRQLAGQGFERAVISVGYLSQLIEAYVGDGSAFGLSVEYLREEKPLGTAGPLGLMGDPDRPFLVMNGDVLTALKYGEVVREHEDSRADVTAVTRLEEFPVDFGVVETDDAGAVVGWAEKPVHTHEISTGIYVVSPAALEHIGTGEALGMPDLIERVIADGGRVASHRTDVYWLDIGRVDDYDAAQKDFEAMKDSLLGGE